MGFSIIPIVCAPILPPSVKLNFKMWPEHGHMLIPGVNDTWNDFQKYSRGKIVSSIDWKKAREVLYLKYEDYLASGGLPKQAPQETCRLKLYTQLALLF